MRLTLRSWFYFAAAIFAACLFGQTVLQTEYDARVYNFIRTNGSGVTANLAATGAKSAALAPCPKGVSSASVNISYVYIDQGTGTAEAAKITSFSQSGANCTIGFTTVNAHTGTFRIRSATGGMQEAVLVAKASGTASGIIPVGIDSAAALYAPVTVTGVQAHFRGNSIQSVAVRRDATFNWDHAFKIYDGGSATFTDMGMDAGLIDGSNAMVKVYSSATSGVLHTNHIIIYQGKYGIISDSAGTTELRDTYILNGDNGHVGTAGILIDCATGSHTQNNVFLSGVISTSYATPQGTRGIDIACVDGLQIENSGFSAQQPMVVDPTDTKYVWNAFITNTFNDNFSDTGLIFASAGSGSIRNFNWTGGSLNCESTGNAGIDFGITFGAPNMDFVTFNGVHISNCKLAGVFVVQPSITATSLAIINSTIFDNNQSNTGYPGLQINTGVTGLRVEGNKIGSTSQAKGINAAGTVSGIIIGNDLCGNTTPFAAGGAITGVVANNRCLNSGLTYTTFPTGLPNGTRIYGTDANSTCTAGSSTGQDCVLVNGAWTH